MSIKVNIYNQKAENVDNMKLSEKIFKVEANDDLIHQALVAQSANERQVLAHTKDRSEVRGGGKKPWKQKGTGRARVGSSRSPIWIGGGITFGPTKDRNFKKKINKKMKQKAIFMVLSDKVSNNKFIILDKVEIEGYKTKVFNDILKNLESKVLKTEKEKRSFLFVYSKTKENDNVKFSGRNLAGVKIINSDNINIFDLLKNKTLILTVDAVKKIEKINNN